MRLKKSRSFAEAALLGSVASTGSDHALSEEQQSCEWVKEREGGAEEGEEGR